MAKEYIHIPREHEKDDRVPLSGGFMITGLLGFIISATFTFSGRFNQWFAWSGENGGNTWGFLFMLFFLLIFIASVASITPKGDNI